MWVQRAALGENCQEKLVWCQTSTFLLRKDVNQSNWVSWGRAKINHNRISVPHLTSAWEKEEIKEILQHILVAWFRATMHCLPFSLGCKVSVLHWLSQQMYSSYTYNDDYSTNCQLCKWHWSSWQADCVLILHISSNEESSGQIIP